MSRSCQSAMSSSPGCTLARSTRASPQSCSHFTGLRLCGIALEPFCSPVRNGSSTSRDLGALEVPDLERGRLDPRAERRARVEQLGVSVAGDHLRRRHRLETEPLADERLDLGIDVGVGADRARELPDRDGGARPHEPGAVAPELERPERELRAERRRLGVDAVRAPDHRRVAVLASTGDDRGVELVDRAEQQVGGAHERDRERGVDDVARREPVVDPGAVRRTDALLDDVDERGDVVVGDALARLDRRRRRSRHDRGSRRRPPAGMTPSFAWASTARSSTSSQVA